MEVKFHRYDITDVDVFNVFYNTHKNVRYSNWLSL